MSSPVIENLPSDLNDELMGKWLADVSSGDSPALSLLYDRVSSRLFDLQLRILNNRALAEDSLITELPHAQDRLEQTELLSLCLERLRPVVQNCIVAIYCDGYTQEEISNSMGRPLGTVKG